CGCRWRNAREATTRSCHPVLLETEEMIAIPTCSCDPLCNLAQGSILLALMLERRRKHRDFDRLFAIHTLQNGPDRRQPRIAPATGCRLKPNRSVGMPKPARCTQA